MELMVLIEDKMAMMKIILGIMEKISINMLWMEFTVHFGTVKSNPAPWLDTLEFVSNLMREMVEQMWKFRKQAFWR